MRADPTHRSLAFGLVQSCMQLGIATGPVLGSALVPEVGIRGLFAVGGVLLSLAALGMLGVWWMRRRGG